ncbi:amidase [Castellaniella sp.]|uniref:amidase n=1 Tax=Castellaniella sp. TaxID=1955812 RepID=UPI002AFF6B48|nr:amidase [Castellaniella sp.]
MAAFFMTHIRELAHAYQAGDTRPSTVLRALLDKIQDGRHLNTFISVDPDQVMRDALSADRQLAQSGQTRPLLGIPIAVKDLIDVAGMRTTMGSSQYQDAPAATEDAPVVARLRAQGAIIIGKTNTHEFAYGSTGDRSVAGPARNPVDPSHMTGGSSSGSAAALAAGLCLGALGSDTSASIRLPAAFCGVVGLKPSYDLLPCQGAFPLSSTLDHVGPMARCVQDNALLLDCLSPCTSGQSYEQYIGASIHGRTVGLIMGFYHEYLSDDVMKATEHARNLFEQAGARVIPVEIPDIQRIYDAQQTILKAEAFHVHQQALESGLHFQEGVRERLMSGADILAANYLEALAFRPWATEAFNQALDRVDILFSPTCGITAPLLDERSTSLNGRTYSTPWLLTRLTAPTNFSMHPSLSIPLDQDHLGLPIGIQLIGRLRDEAKLYQYGYILEQSQAAAPLP